LPSGCECYALVARVAVVHAVEQHAVGEQVELHGVSASILGGHCRDKSGKERRVFLELRVGEGIEVGDDDIDAVCLGDDVSEGIAVGRERVHIRA